MSTVFVNSRNPFFLYAILAPIKKQGIWVAKDNGKALSEVPVPRVRAVECSQIMEEVELYKVLLHKNKLKETHTQ